ncbi:thioredoxin-disulfide reductase [Mycoplasmopsis canis PG 14]|uniref:Thioredoxin reductase n=1 Tax=Mycoplasmopsis canis TaxID=29555 RepID=A0A449ARM7_9BACT|nr:FAD-dependent oxidoreductase [Mycoplasmopsis canis]AMD81555.1 thioredoxin reductase [Mycoplasmopsis canis PG 14]EIE39427.1 thioredoxin-disulfide reductase [Mycoplasmopsis canis PG 14]VEU69188.1 thioredoxin reductase [Mycoplasmopsis canis]
MEERKIYDLIIIGGGPAGLNAALYASRANLKVIFIEKGAPGGKLSLTNKIENWLGTEIIEGWQLATNFFDHAKRFGAEYKYGEVVNIINHGDFDKEVMLSNNTSIYGRTVLISTGMKNREPSFIKNYDSFLQGGISFCAICDGPLFKNSPTIVLGGGNSAVEEGTYLTKIASHVYFVIREKEFTAEKKLVEDLYKAKNVTIFKESQIDRLEGDKILQFAIIKNNITGEETKVEVSSFFPYIGMEATTTFVNGLDILDEKGFIITDEHMQTKVKGIFAAGDIRHKEIRQIVTAANDGAIAAKKISDLLNSIND